MTTAIVIVIAALIFSAFFSGMEIAFLSSNKLKLEIEKKNNSFFSRISERFTRNPSQYITTLLVGNNIALVIYSLQMTMLLTLLFNRVGWSNSVAVDTLMSTVIIIFSAEFLPKATFRSNPNFYFRLFALPVYFFYILFYPIAVFTTFLARLILRLVGFKLKKDSLHTGFDKVDLAHLLEEASQIENSAQPENDIRLFQNALEFHDLKVRDCMVPRIDIDAIDIEDPFFELTKTFVDTRFSRILIYEGSIDNIVGYAHSKSMFDFPQTIRQIVRPVLYVPESMEVQNLLTRFIKDNSSIAIVIDEFGGTAGMVTIEDILEEIFGEIEDEHDSQDMIEKKINDRQFIFSCRLEVEYLNEKFDLRIPESDEYDTLAGYIIFNHGGLPKQGETIPVDDFTFKVIRVNGSKLDLVRMTIGNGWSGK